jgi:hypothetical protein
MAPRVSARGGRTVPRATGGEDVHVCVRPDGSGVVIPSWMFDSARCASMLLVERGYPSCSVCLSGVKRHLHGTVRRRNARAFGVGAVDAEREEHAAAGARIRKPNAASEDSVARRCGNSLTCSTLGKASAGGDLDKIAAGARSGNGHVSVRKLSGGEERPSVVRRASRFTHYRGRGGGQRRRCYERRY